MLNVEYLERLLVQSRVSGDGGGGVCSILTLPGSNGPAGSLDDRDDRQEVPGVHDRVQHQVGPAGGHLGVAIAISPGADVRNLLREQVESPGILILVNEFGIGDQQGCLCQILGITDTDRGAVETGFLRGADTAEIEGGVVDAPDNRLPLWRRPIKVPKRGTPEINESVPSIGSMTQTHSACSRSEPNSSAMIPC
jgi:hypothetical protein